MLLGLLLILGLFLAMTALTGLVIYGSIRKTRWGINLSPITCPVCGTVQRQTVRLPKSTSQALWGGYTCATCGTEIDKWGRTRTP